MKQIALTLFLLAPLMVFGQDYYFNNAGSDSHAGCPIINPCATITKANTLSGSKHFAANQEFVGVLNPKANDLYNTYGAGSPATITGLKTLTGWTNLGGGWYSKQDLSLPAFEMMVTVDGSQDPVARYPKASYLTYNSYSGNTSITAVTTLPTWTGNFAQIGIRKNHYVLDWYVISGVSGKTISYTGGGGTTDRSQGAGFFLQNAKEFCTSNLDWYYNPSLHTVYMLFTGGDLPTNHTIRASNTQIGATVSAANVTFNNIRFEGQNQAAIRVLSVANSTITGCPIVNQGQTGILGFALSNMRWSTNTFDHNNNTAITVQNATNYVINGNTLTNIGIIPGLGQNIDQSSGGQGSYEGITVVGSSQNGTVNNNIITSTGYNPIHVNGQLATVQNNYIRLGSSVMDDGASGIYHHGGSTLAAQGQIYVLNNIIADGVGAPAGTVDGKSLAPGIYTDDASVDMTLSGNVISNCPQAGIYNHNSQRISDLGNLIINCPIGIQLAHDGVFVPGLIRGMVINTNQIITTQPGQLNLQLTSLASNSSDTDLTLFGTAANNLYATTSGILSGFKVSIFPGTIGTKIWNLAQWQGGSHQDAGSTFTNVIPATQFGTNPTQTSLTLPSPYTDLAGNSYAAGTLSLSAYTGKFLIQAGAVVTLPIPSYSPNSYTLTVGVSAGTISPTNIGGVATSWGISPTLSPGLAFNSTNGNITGVPTVQQASTTYTVSATNAAGTATTPLQITVNSVKPNLSYSPSTYTFPVGTAIPTINIANSGGAVTSAYSISPSLPASLSFNTTTAAITGTPGAIHSATTYSIIGSNVSGADTATVTITIADIMPAFTYPSPNTEFLHRAIVPIVPTSTGGNVVTWSISPALPSGLSISSSTGRITGTPNVTSGYRTYTVSGVNGIGTGHATFQLRVLFGRNPPSRAVPGPPVIHVH